MNGVCDCSLHAAIRLRVFFSGLGRNHCSGAAAELFGAPCGRQQRLSPMDDYHVVSPEKGGVTTHVFDGDGERDARLIYRMSGGGAILVGTFKRGSDERVRSPWAVGVAVPKLGVRRESVRPAPIDAVELNFGTGVWRRHGVSSKSPLPAEATPHSDSSRAV